MASSNPNPNQNPQIQPPQGFDMHQFFNPSAPSQPQPPQPPPPSSSSSSSPNLLSQIQNPNLLSSSHFPVPPQPNNFSYPPQTTPFQHLPHPLHYQFFPNPNPNPNHLLPQMNHQLQVPNFPPDHHQRSISYPALPLQPPPNPPNSGARIMALLGAPPPPPPPELPPPPPPPLSPAEFGSGPVPVRMPSSKLPRGRHLGGGDRAVYNVDVRLPGEVQPQLEVTPITKYGSDPLLVLGRQIAVNRSYICYGLKQGNIRVLNIHSALRALFRAHTQRVTDMAFFAEDVHLLASVSVEGRLFVWKISEGPDEEGTPLITGKIVIAVQIVGDEEALHPRICWHSHKQEVLVVGFGKRVLRFDTTKVGKGEVYTAEEPLKISVEKLIDGVQFVGKHEGEITDLSMCQWMTTRLVSASMDGTVKIWEDRKAQPLAVLRPHDGQPVNAATFLTSPNKPDHIILITAGPLNREVKIWASDSEEGWFRSSDNESWKCTQTLELKSSAESRVEDAFFNQVVALPHAGLLLLANAKKNAIYAVHLEYGLNPVSTRMDYIAEFTVTMPILSFTGTSISPHGEHILQVYCVQTQAIQQYALDLSQCLPPPLDSSALERSDSNVSRDGAVAEGFSATDPSGSKQAEIAASREIISRTTEPKPGSMIPSTSGDTDVICAPSPPLPMSPGLSKKISGLRTPLDNFESGSSFSDHTEKHHVNDYLVDNQVDDDQRSEGKKVSQDDLSCVISPSHAVFKHPTHLITPSEILMAASSSESTRVVESKGGREANIQDVLVNGDADNVELEDNAADEPKCQNDNYIVQEESQNVDSENKEKYFYSQASDLGIEMSRERSALSNETYVIDEAQNIDGTTSSTELPAEPSHASEEGHDSNKEASAKVSESSISAPIATLTATPNSKSKKKGKGSQASAASSSPSPSVRNSTDSVNEAAGTIEVASPQILAMQETINQLLVMQKEMHKQIPVLVNASVTKEIRKLETSLGRSMEKALKANSDALWARFVDENSKNDKLSRERTSNQITTSVSNLINKELAAAQEKTIKKEMATVGPAVARTISPAIEKTISSAIVEAFQRGVGDKAVNQLDKSVNAKIEATVARQIQAQFQTSGKQALQDALKSSFEALVVPAFEMSCKAMFEQVDATFQKGFAEHSSANQQHFETSHSPLALSLRETINAASSVAQTLSVELADGQRKLIALAAAGANGGGVNALTAQLCNGPLGGLHEKIEAPLDPTKELSKLVSEHKYEEAFTGALQRSDVNLVSWLCSQVDMPGILSTVPLPLSQGVLLSLLQQLSCDIHKETSRKLGWMTEVAAAINPTHAMIAMHVRPIFEQVYQILLHQRASPTMTGPDQTSLRLLMHVINSMLTTCK